MKKEFNLSEQTCKNCGQTRENHPVWNGLTGRWSKRYVKGQHRLRGVKWMCKKFEIDKLAGDDLK